MTQNTQVNLWNQDRLLRVTNVHHVVEGMTHRTKDGKLVMLDGLRFIPTVDL